MQDLTLNQVFLGSSNRGFGSRHFSCPFLMSTRYSIGGILESYLNMAVLGGISLNKLGNHKLINYLSSFIFIRLFSSTSCQPELYLFVPQELILLESLACPKYSLSFALGIFNLGIY